MKNKIIVSIISAILMVTVFAGIFAGGIKAEAASLKVGGDVTIGKFEQDGNGENGKEAIVWRVLCTREGKALLLSDKILDCRKFNGKDVASWSASDMRIFLNGEFYAGSFTDEEKKFIIKSKISNMSLNETGDKLTEDYIFLLSTSEVTSYKDVIGKYNPEPAKTALNKNLFLKDGKGYWWLRTAGADSEHVTYVNPDGSVYKAGCSASYLNFGGVRPAMWVDLAKAELGGNTLTINYTFGNGKKAAESYSAAITAGEAYSINSPAVGGYSPDKMTVSGTMGKKDVEITVVYKDSSKKTRSIDPPRKQSGEGGVVNLASVKVVGDGTVEYGYSLTNDVSTVANWQESTIFKDLMGGNKFYFFAKVTGSKTYNDAFSKSNSISVPRSDREIDAPEILNFTHNAVAGYEINAYGGGKVTYGIASVKNPGRVSEWKNYPVFVNLSPGVKYYLYAKAAKTEHFKEAYACTEFTTASSKSGSAIAGIKEVTANSIVIESAVTLTGVPEYGITDKKDPASVKSWQKGTTFNNLEAGTRYYIYVKLDGVDTKDFTCSSAVTLSGGRTVMPPEIVSVEGNTITVEKVTVVGNNFVYFGISKENNADTVSVWQIENVFYNLSVDTNYYVFARMTNGNAEEDVISDGVEVKTGSAKTEKPTEEPTPTVTPTVAPNTDDGKKEKSAAKIVLIIVAVALVVVLLGGGAYYFFVRRRSR